MNLKDKFQGKVITLAGNPAAGKTFLAEILTAYFDAEFIREHTNAGFPIEIQDNLRCQKNLFETIVFFRNIQIDNHLKAIEISKTGKTVIIETPFFHNQIFIDLYVEDQFRRNILYELGAQDLATQHIPDVTIYIKTSEKLVKEYLYKRSGSRDWERTEWTKFISQMPPKVDEFMKKISPTLTNLITLERASYDFKREEDISQLLMKLDQITF